MSGGGNYQDDDRDLTDYERQALMQFKQTDEEIDQMLDVILDQLDRLKLHA